MLKRCAGLLFILPLVAIGVSAQGLDTKASANDWEEINFEFNSSVLVDGFPSLLRLAELLQKNPGYKVMVEGHTDRLGSDNYNDKLGLARANTIRDFLVKYGSRPAQIEVGTRGKADPKYPGQKPTYTKTDEARWMNRRVVLTVMDDQGRTVSAAGVGEAIRAIEPPKAAGMTDCCSEVLKRLDKLDDIARLLQGLNDQNADLKRQLDALKQAEQVLESKVNQPSGAPAPSTDQVAQAVAKELDKKKEPKFSLLGVNLGMDQDGDLTATAKGRFFGPFGEHYAVQSEGEYLYFKTDKEAQFDLGLVDRVSKHFQAGLFGSFKHVELSGNQFGATLGQASFVADYLTKWGKVGVFGTYGFMNSAMINNVAALSTTTGLPLYDVYDQTYLRVDNQAGVSFTTALWGNNYLEGNIGYIKSFTYGDRAGGTLRFVFPINNKIAFTLEGDLNPTIIGRSNDGRVVAGVQLGNMMRPKEYLGVDHPVPMDIPRVRFEEYTRTVRTGHTPPIANAGPDQIGVPAGTITLNGSASYSPDGLPITFQWVQQGGPAITLSNPTSAITTFTSTGGNTYIFMLTVTDSLGGTGQARVRITTQASNKPVINFFVANPASIQPGQSSTLSWGTEYATTVSLTVVGAVSPSGSSSVTPAVTTTYTLTASNASGSVTATATVVVAAPATSLTFCYASPSNIILGESSTLYYQAQNATSVTITPGVGTFGASGNVAVTPTSTTNYTITATGNGGQTASCTVGVTVTTGQLPRIIRFSAAPMNISTGQSSTLFWVVENATTVNINQGIGNVSLGGSQSVSPAASTTYTLTATNQAGSVTAMATVNVRVIPPPVIVTFTATPNPSPSPGAAVTLFCSTTGAVSMTLAGFQVGPPEATLVVHPTTTTTYTCLATGSNGATASKSITVTVTPASPPPSTTPPVIVIAGGNTINTISRFLTIDASGSYSPGGNTPLTFLWTSSGQSIAILNSTSPIVNIQLNDISGVYTMNLTVTDSKGNSSTTVVTINFSNLKVQGQP
jgi:hypothetical protein